MYSKIFRFFMFSIYLYATGVQAQNEAPAFLDFPPSIATRIFEVTSKVELSTHQQNLLGRFYVMQDSLLYALIQKGAQASDIEMVKHNLHGRFLHILTPAIANAYYTKLFTVQARNEGNALAQQASEKYQIDSPGTRALAELYFKRQLNADKAYYTDSPDSALLDIRLKRVLGFYDSLIDKALTVAAGRSYINAELDRLNAIKPLTEEQRTHLVGSFNKLNKSNDQGFASNFGTALHKVINDTTYYSGLYQTELEESVSVTTAYAVRKLGRKQKITKEAVPEITALIKQREWIKAVYNKTYTNAFELKDSLTNGINRLYDSLINLALMDDGSALGDNQFAIALKYRTTLMLNTQQTDSLRYYAEQLKHSKDTFNLHHVLLKMDTKAYEAQHMKMIVTDSQYTAILYIKNRPNCIVDAQNDWKEMQLRNLTAGYEETAALKSLANYYITKWNAYYRYSDDITKRKAQVKNIEEHAPACLKALNAAVKNDNPVTGDAGRTYKW